MQNPNVISIKEINKILKSNDYVPNNEISTTLYLSLLLSKPTLIEGPPGVGKTEFAKVLALNRLLVNGIIKNSCYF